MRSFSEVRAIFVPCSGFRGWALKTHGDGSLLPVPPLDQVLLGKQLEAIVEELSGTSVIITVRAVVK